MKLETIYAQQDKIVKRRRRGKAICLAVIAAGVAVCLYSIARLVPIYGAWARENRYSRISMCRIDTPAYLELSVNYDSASAPRNLRIVHDETGTIIRNPSITDEDGVLTVSCDIGPDLPSGNWSVQMIPGANRKISCQADVYPSYKFITGKSSVCRDAAGHIWLFITGHYDRCLENQAMSVTIKLHGPDYATDIYDVQVNGSLASTWLDLDMLTIAKYRDIRSASEIEILMTAQYEPPEGSEEQIGYARYQNYIMPGDIPACEHGQHDTTATDDYIRRTTKQE